MLQLATLNENPAAGFVPDPRVVIQWLRRAVDAAKPSSPAGEDAVLRLAHRLEERGFAGAAEELLQCALNQPHTAVFRAKATLHLQMIAIRGGDLDRAQQLCLQIQAGFQNAANAALASWESSQIDLIQDRSRNGMKVAWSRVNTPVAQQKLQDLNQTYRVREAMVSKQLLR